MARQGGLGSWGQERVSQSLSNAPGSTKPKVAHVPGQQSGQRTKVHAGAYTLDEAFNEEAHDLGPWIETPKSSRCAAFRYDYLNNAVQMTWRNGRPSYIYLGVSYEEFRSLARSPSKGRHINLALGPNHDFRKMTPYEESAPSNAERKAAAFKPRVQP